MTEILEFLKDLQANNDREWFDANRKRYEKCRAIQIDFTAKLIAEIRKFDDEIPPLNAKDSVFRIFRDVRFSKDKSPYKTNMGSYVARGGKNGGYSGYYFHIQPGELFVSGGIYMPQPQFLHAIRQEIYYHPNKYIELIENPTFKSTFTGEKFDKLKTAPKGYPKDWEHIELIKNRSYAYSHPLTEKEFTSENLLETVVNTYKILYPINKFLNSAIDENLDV